MILSIMLVPWTNKRHSETIPASAIWADVMLTDGARELDTEAEYTEIERNRKREWERKKERERVRERVREKEREWQRERQRDKKRERKKDKEKDERQEKGGMT